MSTALYAQLKAKVDELHDPDEDVTAHAAAMGVLNALWPTVEALARDRDRLRLIIADASAADGVCVVSGDTPGPDGTPIEFRSPDSPTVIYACRHCLHTVGGTAAPMIGYDPREHARTHCLCKRCGAVKESLSWGYCTACLAIDRAEKEAALNVRLLALPVVDGSEYDDMVYLPAHDAWRTDEHDAAEYVWDLDLDPTEAIAHPSRKSRLPVPDLDAYVDEAWGSEFSDDHWDGLSPEASAVLASAMEALAAWAPEIYTPDTKVRIELHRVVSGVDAEGET